MSPLIAHQGQSWQQTVSGAVRPLLWVIGDLPKTKGSAQREVSDTVSETRGSFIKKGICQFVVSVLDSDLAGKLDKISAEMEVLVADFYTKGPKEAEGLN